MGIVAPSQVRELKRQGLSSAPTVPTVAPSQVRELKLLTNGRKYPNYMSHLHRCVN